MGKKALDVTGTYFNKRRKLGILDKTTDVISVLPLSASLVLQCAFHKLVEGLFRLNTAKSD